MAATATRTANALPTRLQDFFARYPPQLYSAKFTGIKIPLTRRDAKEAAVVRSAQLEEAQASIPQEMRLSRSMLAQPILVPSTTSSPSEALLSTESGAEDTSTPTPTTPPSQSRRKFPSNPFLPRKNFSTGGWAGPKIGLRRQAELVKLAQQYNIEELLPPGKKSTAFKEERLLERGLRIKGTGEGQKVKGHKWERRMPVTLDKRRKAMENMPQLIREWKQKGHGRGWSKYPSSKASKN
ncbi:54S ribosomal protein L25, mitochondrial [Cladophialophora chaetospira]|uniref:54S ribosomal protein L25, mitochondrial n=1 Tax=Cladophialophora chaetospira TaxID=386627 RepID=A0AA39CEC2_9EURO|nr:54S ribosomal protein L25, mitochondrial [Cladophialophora chaetospira]